MHLGLIDGPYVPHNLILAQGSPVPDGPQTQILNVLCIKKKEHRYAFSPSLKSSSK
jgi:hypothetical protein